MPLSTIQRWQGQTSVVFLSGWVGCITTRTYVRVHYDQYAGAHGNEDDEVFRDDDDVRRVARPVSSHFRILDG